MRPDIPSPYELYIRYATLSAALPKPGTPIDAAIFATGFQAVEIYLDLLPVFLRDDRVDASIERRIDKLRDCIVRAIGLVHDGLRMAPDSMAAGDPGDVVVSPGLDGLSLAPHDLARPIVDAIRAMLRDLELDCDLDDQLQRLVPVADAPRRIRRHMRYDALVRPDIIVALQEDRPFGPEDRFFCAVHQAAEVWLNLYHHLLDEAERRAAGARWDEASPYLHLAGDVLSLCAASNQLLELMVPRAFQPLRVRLRDGSGALSRAARRVGSHARAIGDRFFDRMRADGLTPKAILAGSDRYPGHYANLFALDGLGRRIQGFLFDHYMLVLSSLGTESFGSLGYMNAGLMQRAARPMFPEFDAARHDFVMEMNLFHSNASGGIIARKEQGLYPAIDADTLSDACPVAGAADVVSRYFACFDSRDEQAWIALFEPDGELHDSEDSRPYRGRDHLLIFFQSTMRAFRQIKGTIGEPVVKGNRADVRWRFETLSYHDRPATFGGTETFVFSRSGRIRLAAARWDPGQVVAQWQRHEAAAVGS